MRLVYYRYTEKRYLMIYVIKEKDTENYKIGYTGKTARSRMAELQVANPTKLVYVTSFPGDMRHEKVIHKIFLCRHIRGEWFRLSRSDLETLLDKAWLENHVYKPVRRIRQGQEIICGCGQINCPFCKGSEENITEFDDFIHEQF